MGIGISDLANFSKSIILNKVTNASTASQAYSENTTTDMKKDMEKQKALPKDT